MRSAYSMDAELEGEDPRVPIALGGARHQFAPGLASFVGPCRAQLRQISASLNDRVFLRLNREREDRHAARRQSMRRIQAALSAVAQEPPASPRDSADDLASPAAGLSGAREAEELERLFRPQHLATRIFWRSKTAASEPATESLRREKCPSGGTKIFTRTS